MINVNWSFSKIPNCIFLTFHLPSCSSTIFFSFSFGLCFTLFGRLKSRESYSAWLFRTTLKYIYLQSLAQSNAGQYFEIESGRLYLGKHFGKELLCLTWRLVSKILTFAWSLMLIFDLSRRYANISFEVSNIITWKTFVLKNMKKILTNA